MKENDGIEARVVCLHQVIRKKGKLPFELYKAEGQGNCDACKYDPINNPRCSGYEPIKVYYVNKTEG